MMNERVKKLGKGDREKRKSLQTTVSGHQPNPQATNQTHGKVSNEKSEKLTEERELLRKLS